MAHNNQGQLPLADRGRAGGSLTDSIPELGELIPVDEFFQDYIGSLGRAPSFGQVLASRQGSRGPENGPAAAMPSSATSRGGQLGPQSRPMPPTFWQQGQQAQQGPPMQQQQSLPGLQSAFHGFRAQSQGLPLTAGMPMGGLQASPQEIMERNTSLENAHMAAQQAQQAQQAHAMQQLLSGANGAVNPALAAQYVSMLNAQAGFLGSGGQVTQELIRKLVQAGPALSMPPPAQIYPTRLLHQLQTPKGAPLGPNDRSGRNGTGRPGADGHAQRNSAPSGNDIHEDGDKSDTAQSTGMDGVSQQGTSKNNRTARQQLQNKQAQQRYRERRKRKVVEMEQAVTVMSQQVDELQTVLKQNVALQEKNMALEQALAEKDRQVAAMQDSLRQQPQSGEAGRPSGGGGSGEGSDGPVAAFEGMSDLKLEFQGQIMKLEHFIEMHNLRDADPFGANIAKDVLDAMNTLIEDGCRVCRRVQAEGVQVLNLIARDPQSLSVFATDMEAEKWSRALQAIKLAPMQKGQMLMWREEHLRNMADIYRERAALNLQAIGVMMPRKDHDTNTPLEECSVLQHVEDMQTSGYLQTAKSNLVLSNLLDEIKDNLKREQKLVLQFNWVLMNRILTPIQSALFMVHAWPSHCDCLALANACHRAAEQGKGSQAAREGAAAFDRLNAPLTGGLRPAEASQTASVQLSTAQQAGSVCSVLPSLHQQAQQPIESSSCQTAAALLPPQMSGTACKPEGAVEQTHQDPQQAGQRSPSPAPQQHGEHAQHTQQGRSASPQAPGRGTGSAVAKLMQAMPAAEAVQDMNCVLANGLLKEGSGSLLPDPRVVG